MNFKKLKVSKIKPETKWSNYEQAEVKCLVLWRAALVYVEKYWDDLWLGVKGQSNLEIAGFLRNLSK